jgi:hypothetical protein
MKCLSDELGSREYIRWLDRKVDVKTESIPNPSPPLEGEIFNSLPDEVTEEKKGNLIIRTRKHTTPTEIITTTETVNETDKTTTRPKRKSNDDLIGMNWSLKRKRAEIQTSTGWIPADILPKVSEKDINNPKIGDLIFDPSDNLFKGYVNGQWKSLAFI